MTSARSGRSDSGRPLERNGRRRLAFRRERGHDGPIPAGRRQCAVQAAQQQSAIDPQSEHAEALPAAFQQILVTGGDDSAMLAGGANRILDRQQFLGHARPFPLSAVAGRRGIVGRTEEENLHAVDLQHGLDVPAALDRLDDRHHQDVLVGLLGVLDEALSPAGGPLGADAADAFRRIMGEADRLPQLLGRFHPRHDHAVGSDVERPLDQPDVQFGHADQHHGIAADRGPNVFDDLLPVEMPVFGVDDDPIHAQGHGHFGDAGRFQRDPQAVDRLIGGQLATQFVDGGCFHVRMCPGGERLWRICARRFYGEKNIPDSVALGLLIVSTRTLTDRLYL